MVKCQRCWLHIVSRSSHMESSISSDSRSKAEVSASMLGDEEAQATMNEATCDAVAELHQKIVTCAASYNPVSYYVH